MPSEMKGKGKPDPKWPAHSELPEVMTVPELSVYLHVHPTTIYRPLKQHRIPAFRVGSDGAFSIEDIDRRRLQQENFIARRNPRQ